MLISSALHSALNWTGTPISCSAVFVLWSFSLQHQLLKICCNDGGTEIVVHYAKSKMYSAGNFSCKLYQINESVFSCRRNMLGNGSGKTLAVMIFAKSMGAVVNSMKPNWSVQNRSSITYINSTCSKSERSGWPSHTRNISEQQYNYYLSVTARRFLWCRSVKVPDAESRICLPSLTKAPSSVLLKTHVFVKAADILLWNCTVSLQGKNQTDTPLPPPPPPPPPWTTTGEFQHMVSTGRHRWMHLSSCCSVMSWAMACSTATSSMLYSV